MSHFTRLASVVLLPVLGTLLTGCATISTPRTGGDFESVPSLLGRDERPAEHDVLTPAPRRASDDAAARDTTEPAAESPPAVRYTEDTSSDRRFRRWGR